jgi:hypothetical protein
MFVVLVTLLELDLRCIAPELALFWQSSNLSTKYPRSQAKLGMYEENTVRHVVTCARVQVCVRDTVSCVGASCQ